MMKPIDEEHRGLKLESLKELLKSMKKGSLEKLPKGKGVSVMSVSVSKPKDSEEESDDMEEVPSPEMSEKELPIAGAEEPSDSVEEEADEVEEDDQNLPEPSVPSELLELVKMMLKNKKEAE